MPRRLKQFAYLLLFAAFWGAVAGGAYWLLLKPAPSCFDHIQNQGEEGVDCGGPCQQFCIPATLMPVQVVGQPSVFQPVPELTSVAVKLQNQNPTFAAREFAYTATIYGDTGSSSTVTGTSYIYAGEVKYLALLRPTGSLGRPVSATFVISSPVWQPDRLFHKPAVRVQNEVASMVTDGSLRVDGVVASDDTLPVSAVTLTALFFGSQNQLIGVSATQLDSLTAGATAPFTIVHPPLSGFVPDSTQVYVSAQRP